MGREFVHTCNNCKSHVETRYHCTVCDDFDLCVSCKDKNGHPHPMKKVRKLSIQRCIQSLVHACQCRDANCHLPSCCKMKRVIMHTKNCKRKTNGGCRICKQLITLCCYHAKHCKETKCLVPFCSNIKHKTKQQQLQQRLQQPQLLRRQIAVIAPQIQRPLPVQMPNPGSHLISMDQSTARYQTNTVMQQNPNLARQQTPQQLMQQQQPHQAQPGMAMTAQMPRQPGVIGGQVGPQASNMHNDAPQQLMQTLRSPLTSEQQNQMGISHPPWLAAFMNQRGVHPRQPPDNPGGGGILVPNQPQQQPYGLQHMMSQQQQSQQQQQQLQQRLQQAPLVSRQIVMSMRPCGPMTRQTVSRLQMSP